MAILLDISGILHSSLHQSRKFSKGGYANTEWGNTEPVEEFSEHNIRALVLNSIKFYRNKFKDKYGEIVLACDSGNVWRKKYYPYYKQGRKAGRESSDIPWDKIFNIFRTILTEIDENFQYKVIQIETMEADDIIATICMQNIDDENHMIVSSDKDLVQLQRYPNVYQWSHGKKEQFHEDNPEQFLYEQILSGDKGDGVPNVLSDDDVFIIDGKRQNTLTQKRRNYYRNTSYNNYTSEEKRKFDRNKKMIDLSEIPENLQELVIIEYAKEKQRKGLKINRYLVKNKLSHLLTHAGKF